MQQLRSFEIHNDILYDKYYRKVHVLHLRKRNDELSQIMAESGIPHVVDLIVTYNHEQWKHNTQIYTNTSKIY